MKNLTTAKLMSVTVTALVILTAAYVEVAAQADPQLEMMMKQREAISKKAKETLATRVWTIYLTPREAQKRAETLGDTDVLTLTANGKVSSQALLAKGYEQSNYGARVEGNDVIVWETMQVHPQSEDRAFLHGELKTDGVMAGNIVFEASKGGPSSTYSFSSVPAESPVAAKKKDKE